MGPDIIDQVGSKTPKSAVNYRPAEGAMSCANCKHFAPPQACEIVDGVINPNGVSNAFEPATEQESGNAPQPMQNSDALMSMFSGQQPV